MIEFTMREGVRFAVGTWCAVLMLLAFTACGPSLDSATEDVAPTATSAALPRGIASLGTQEKELEDWLVFHNAEARCSFQYPREADIDAGIGRDGTYTVRLQFQMPEAKGYQGMVIHVVPIDDSSSLDDVLEQLFESNPQDLSFEEWLEQAQDTTVGDFTGLKTVCSVGSSDFSVVIPRPDRVYVASPSHDMAAACADPQALDLFYRVLETFVVEEEPAA